MPVQSKNARHHPTLRRVCAVAALKSARRPPCRRTRRHCDHPIKLVVPFPPRRLTDLVSRVIAKKMSKTWPAGGGGQPPRRQRNIGGEMVAKAPADGYRGAVQHLVHRTESARCTRSCLRREAADFAPVAMSAMVPLVLEVNAKVPANTVAEFVWPGSRPTPAR